MDAAKASRWRGTASRLGSLWRDEDATTTTEYALLLGVLVIGSVVAFGQLGDSVESVAVRGTDALEEATGMSCSWR